MVEIIPRPYQRKAVDNTLKAYNLDSGTDSGIHCIATGLGKTIISILTTKEGFHPKDGKRTIFAGGINRELVFQGHENYAKFMPELKQTYFYKGRHRRGIGIVMGNVNQVDAGLMICSMPTLVDKLPGSNIGIEGEDKVVLPEDEPIETSDVIRDSKGNVFLNPNSKRKFLVTPRIDQILENGLIDCFIYDEAHHSVSNGSLSMFNRLKSLHEALDVRPMFNIGNTATPNRTDELGLSNIYQTIFSSLNIFWGISHGYLSPLLTPVRMEIGELVESDSDGNTLESFESELKSVDNWADMMVQGWKDQAQDRPTFVYIGKMNDMSALESSKYLSFKFNEAGVTSAHIDYNGCIGPDGTRYKADKRGEILSLYKQGKIKILCNYGVLIEGIDAPLTSCIMIARKVNELQFTQIIGRGLRLFKGDKKLGLPEKDGLLLIDTTGQVLTVDTIASIIGYTVDPTDRDKIILDPAMVHDLMQQVQEIWYDTDMQKRVREWTRIQTKYKTKTLEKSIYKALKMAVDKATTIDCAVYRVIIEVAYSEDDILNAMDMQGEEVITKKGVSTRFSEFEIARSSKNDWNFDATDGTAALQVSEKDALVILSPNYQAHTRIMKMKMMAEQLLVNPTKTVNHLLLNKGDEPFLVSFVEAMEVYKILFGDYTLWHVNLTKIKNPFIVVPGDAPTNNEGNPLPWFVLSENNLYDLTIAASKYAYSQTQVTDEFIRKNASWKKRKLYGEPESVTNPQRFMLKKLKYNGGDVLSMSKASASALITSLASSPPVKMVRDNRLKEVAKLWNLRKE